MELSTIELDEEPITAPSFWSLAMLLALTLKGKHVYGGTVPYHVKAQRRAKNRVAKASRKANRR